MAPRGQCVVMHSQVSEADPERNIRPSSRHDMALVRLAGRASQLLSGICRRPVFEQTKILSLEAGDEMILRIDHGHGDQNQRALNSDLGA